MRFKLKLSKKDFFMFALLAPLLEPYAIQVLYRSAHRLFLLAKLACIIIIFALFILNSVRKKKRVSPQITIWVIFWCYLLANTIIQGRITNDFFVGALSMIAGLMLVDLNIDRPRHMLSVLLVCFEILIYLNLITMILAPQGMYISNATGNTENWLLGYDNFFEQTFIPAYITALLYGYLYKKFLRAGLLIICIHISALFTYPGTLLICLLFLDILYFFGIYKLKRLFNLRNMILVILAANIGILLFDIQTQLGQIIFALLNKDVTFTGRTRIWELSMYQILQSPIIGYGFSDGTYRLTQMQNLMRGAFNCHNEYLEILWEGGVVLLFIFVASVLFMIKKTNETKELRTTQIITLGICAFFIAFIAKAHIQMTPIPFTLLVGLTNYPAELERSKLQ